MRDDNTDKDFQMDSSGARRILGVTENGKENVCDTRTRPCILPRPSLEMTSVEETADSPVSSDSRGAMTQRSPSSTLIFSWGNRRREGGRDVSNPEKLSVS